MTTESLLFAALRAAVVLGLALAAMLVLRRAAAATRRTVLVFAFALVVLLPIATAALPPLHLRGARAEPDTAALVAASSPDPIASASAMAGTPAATALSVAPTAHSTSDPWLPSPLAIMLALWALGAFVVLARLAVGLRRAHRIARTARLVEVRRIGAGARAPNVEVRSSAEIDTPAVTGLFSPVILLPRDADTWTDERRELVLAHELAHVARRDCLANVLAQIAVAMHWFDPLAWLCARRLRIERELAADDRVLDGGATASSYAAHLLALAMGTNPDEDRAREVPSGALAMAEPAQVSVRIRALLAREHSRHAMGRARAIACGVAGIALATVIACASHERAPAPPAIPDAGTRSTPPTAPALAPDSTIDPGLQAIVDDEVDRLVGEWAPRAAVVIVLDPETGHVLAIANRGDAPIAQRAYITGSTMKPFVVAAALEEGVIAATDHFDTNNGELQYAGKTIHDASKHRVLDVAGILAVSSNVGLTRIFDKLGGAKLAAWTKRLHLAESPPAIADGSLEGASIALGQSLAATPMQVAASFAAIANGGTYRAPSQLRTDTAGERVMTETTAHTVLAMLEGVVSGDNGTGKAARVDGVRVAGKTGTARMTPGETSDYYVSFIGAAPVERPRYVILVGAEAPRDRATGGQVAAPAFGRVMKRLVAR